ncbi:dipeptide epimerase [Sulfurimonas aquatica]|uniref:Dipeptide epimerase n=1 Tax=Sulfurimonas aquatica TaxID=2672570 RepID=A0A975B2I3_9BACT|nr:dipeptide epimerase [Sulfurimonas aquatica]
MKIKEILTEVKRIALKTPFITALRRVETIEFVRAKVLCDDGSLGIGEAPATFAITGEDIPIILSSIKSTKEKLLGKDILTSLELLHKMSIGSSAKAALDMAFVSLLINEKCQTPLEYFNIKDKRAIQTDITISLNHKEKMFADAKEALQNGMDILKVKLGSDISHAIEVTKLLSYELPSAKLLIDANQAWSLDESLKYVNAVEDLNIELIEQPVVADDLESLKIITNATKIPILADEATFTLEDVKRAYESSCADMINIKLMKCGGVTKAIEILEYAREKKIICMLGSMLEGPYSINAALYLAFAYRDVIKYVDLDSPLLYKEAPSELDFNFFKNSISIVRDKS